MSQNKAYVAFPIPPSVQTHKCSDNTTKIYIHVQYYFVIQITWLPDKNMERSQETIFFQAFPTFFKIMTTW